MKYLRTFALFQLLLTGIAFPNYEPYACQDFELGVTKIPESLRYGLNSSPLTTAIVDWDSDRFENIVPKDETRTALGSYGFELFPIQSDPYLSVIDQRAIDRQKIYTNGAALFQVDFFIPQDTINAPTMALLANAANDDTEYRFYRFGIDRDRVYFSFTNREAAPEIYLRQPLGELNLEKNQWHRFQMQFKGDGTIICAIDGKITSFSPINEDSLKILEPGIMVTYGRSGVDQPVYADNLGIWQTNNILSRPPAIPWMQGKEAETRVNNLYSNYWGIGQLVEWETTPSDAWKAASENDKPIFALFHSDNDSEKDLILEELRSDLAIGTIQKHIPLRINVSDSSGEFIASRYGVEKFPTIAIFNQDGTISEQYHLSPTEDFDWSKLN